MLIHNCPEITQFSKIHIKLCEFLLLYAVGVVLSIEYSVLYRTE